MEPARWDLDRPDGFTLGDGESRSPPSNSTTVLPPLVHAVVIILMFLFSPSAVLLVLQGDSRAGPRGGGGASCGAADLARCRAGGAGEIEEGGASCGWWRRRRRRSGASDGLHAHPAVHSEPCRARRLRNSTAFPLAFHCRSLQMEKETLPFIAFPFGPFIAFRLTFHGLFAAFAFWPSTAGSIYFFLALPFIVSLPISLDLTLPLRKGLFSDDRSTIRSVPVFADG